MPHVAVALEMLATPCYEQRLSRLWALVITHKDACLGQKKKNSCVQVSLPTLILGPTLKMLKFF